MTARAIRSISKSPTRNRLQRRRLRRRSSRLIKCPTPTEMRKVEIAPDSFSLTSIYIELFFGEACLANATGFAWEHNDKYYLITNWHVATGKHPDDNQPLSKVDSLPDKLVIFLFDSEERDDP